MLGMAVAPKAWATEASVAGILAENAPLIERSSRRTIGPVIDALRDLGSEDAKRVLELWREKELWVRKSDKTFFTVQTDDKKTYQLFDPVTGDAAGEAVAAPVVGVARDVHRDALGEREAEGLAGVAVEIDRDRAVLIIVKHFE